MVGINSAGIPSAEGIGFALAIDEALPVVRELIARGRVDRGYLGISAVDITPGLATAQGFPVTEGLAVVMIVPGSPAQRAGLRVGDIIVSVAGRPVRRIVDLDPVLLENRAGSRLPVELFRGRARLTVEVTLAERPSG